MYNVSDLTYSCPVEALSSILGKKWVGEIIWIMRNDTKRFSELQRLMDRCSKKMLIQQLDLLIENNIVIKDKKELKNITESRYYLSEIGISLIPIMEHMIMWSNENIKCKN